MLNLVTKELKELCLDKRIWIGILTVLIMIIIGTSYNKQNADTIITEQLKLGIINHDESTYSDLLVNNFSGSTSFSSLVSVIVGDENEIVDDFNRGALDVYLEIPENFAGNMMSIENTPIRITMNISDTTKALLFENVLSSYEKYISAVEANAVGLYDIMEQNGMDQKSINDTNMAVSINMVLTALGRESFFSFEPMEQFPATKLMTYYISTILVTALLYSGLYVGFQMLKELEQGTLIRLRTTKTLIYHLILAKMVLFILILSVTLITAVSIILGKLLPLYGILMCISIVMFSVCLAVFLSSIFRTNQRYVLAGNILVFLCTVLGGGIIPIQYLPQDMVMISKFTPYFYMLREIIYLQKGQYTDCGRFIFLFVLFSIIMTGVTAFLYGRRSVIYAEV